MLTQPLKKMIRGTLEVGKPADVSIINKNWLTCIDEETLDTKILYTIVGGEIKYENTIEE